MEEPNAVDLGSDRTADETPTERTRRFALRRGPSELITTARRSSFQNRRRRQRWYLALQFSRVVTTVLAGLAHFVWDNVPLTVVLIVLAIPAPALAVIVANEPHERKDKCERNTYKPGLARQLQAEQEARAMAPPAEQPRQLPVIIDHTPPEA